MSEKRFVLCEITHGWKGTTNVKKIGCIRDMQKEKTYTFEQVVDLLNDQDKTIKELQSELDLVANTKLFSRRKLEEENEQLKNELRKEKSLREYSDSMYGADLIVNIRFSNGEWKADVSVIDDE